MTSAGGQLVLFGLRLGFVVALAWFLVSCSWSREVQRSAELQTSATLQAHQEEHQQASAEESTSKDAGSVTHEERTETREPELERIVERWDRPVAVELPDGGVVVAQEHHERETEKTRGAVTVASKRVEEQHSAEVDVAAYKAALDAAQASRLDEEARAKAALASKAKFAGGPPWWIWLVCAGAAVACILFRVWRFIPWIR